MINYFFCSHIFYEILSLYEDEVATLLFAIEFTANESSWLLFAFELTTSESSRLLLTIEFTAGDSSWLLLTYEFTTRESSPVQSTVCMVLWISREGILSYDMLSERSWSTVKTIPLSCMSIEYIYSLTTVIFKVGKLSYFVFLDKSPDLELSIAS